MKQKKSLKNFHLCKFRYLHSSCCLFCAKNCNRSSNFFNFQLFGRISRKEFSNDPTEEMAEMSVQFETKIVHLQKGISKLSSYADNLYDDVS